MRRTLALAAVLAALATAALVTAAPAQTPVEMRHANCLVAEVAAFTNRVHLRCGGPIYREGASNVTRELPAETPNPLDARIAYYAVDIRAEPVLAAQVVSLGLAARAGGKATVFFRTSVADNPPGCLAHDCRRLTGLVVGR